MVGEATRVKLRLYHHPDGARIAYREAGTGPPLVLLHSAGLSHREFEPAVEGLEHRFRLILPDLPAHGDSEDRPRHPYTKRGPASAGHVADLATPTGGAACAARAARGTRWPSSPQASSCAR